VGRLAAIVSAALVACSVASAQATRTISLSPGGYVYLAGSNVRCGAVHSNGITFVSCGVVLANGDAKRGSYVAAMQSNGRVAIIHAIKPGKTTTVFDRTPAAVVEAAAKTLARPGDHIRIPGTSIACSAGLVSGKATIFCDYVTAGGGARPHSYAFGMSNTLLTSLGWDATSHVHLLGSWPENG